MLMPWLMGMHYWIEMHTKFSLVHLFATLSSNLILKVLWIFVEKFAGRHNDYVECHI